MANNRNINKKPGERLKIWRNRRSVSQELLAEKSGYSKVHISYIENGKRKMTIEAARIFSEILEIREKYLLCYDNFPTAEDYRVSFAESKNDEDDICNLLSNNNYLIEKIESDEIIETFTKPYSDEKVDIRKIDKWLIIKDDVDENMISDKIWSCSDQKMNDFFEDIRLYIMFRIQQLILKCEEASEEEREEWKKGYAEIMSIEYNE